MANIALITNNILTDSGTPLTSIPSGSGTTNYLSKWTSSSALGNSLVYDDGTNVGIGTTTFLGKFQVGSGSATQFQVASSGASIYVGPSSGNYNMNITTNTIQSSNSGTTNTYLYIQPNGSGNVAMCSSGTNKVLIGTTTDAGYKLDVNGTARIAGVATFNNNINQTSGTATFANGILLDSTRRIFGGNTITYQSNDAASQHYFKNDISSGLSGTLVTIGNGSGAFGTTSASNFLNISGRLATASGTNNLTSILLNHTVENTGTYTGTIRGIYYNPSSIVGTGFTHRAIETTTGDVIFNSTSGSVGIGTTSPAYKLQVAGDIGFTAGANRYIRLANPAASGSANHIVIQAASANTSGTGGNIYLYEGSGAGGPGAGSIYIGATTGWTTAYVTGRLTVTNSGPNTETAFQVNAGGQNGLTINWDNVTPYMGYGLVVNRQSRFYNSSSYTFDNNLIIGSNTNAGYKLDIYGNDARLYSTSNTTLTIQRGSSGYGTAINYREGVNSYWFTGMLSGSYNYTINDSNYGINKLSITQGFTWGVGIGTTSPTGKLEVRGNTTNSKDLLLNLSKYDYGSTNFYQNYSNVFYTNGKSLEIEVEALPLLQLAVNNAGSAGKVIFPNGNVGIGTTSPTEKLSVNGNMAFPKSGNTFIYNDQSGADSITIGGASYFSVKTYNGANYTEVFRATATNNLLIGTTTDNGYKLQVAGNTSVTGVTLTSSLNVQNAAEVNSNEGSSDLLVYADLTSGVDVLYGGGKVKANIYTTPVITPKTINPSSTVAFMKWYPTTSQGVFIDYVLYIDSGTQMRSGTVTIVNDTSGNAQLLDTKTADLNGSTANITFAVVNNGGTMEFQVTNSGAVLAHMNILTRYIPTIF